jgi:hypothetical protein
MTAKVVTVSMDCEGESLLAQSSPHAVGERRSWLADALLPKMGPLSLERAARVFRVVPEGERYPQPEACAPYQNASGLGFMLRPRLPLLFVKTRRGEFLPDARTALAYARENLSDFAEALGILEKYAPSVLDGNIVARYQDKAPLLFCDIATPYATFGHEFFAIPAGLYVSTNPGVGTVIGPPMNRTPCLPVQTGMIETDWHHRLIFVVVRYPQFSGRSLLVMPEQDLAQVYYVAYRDTLEASVEPSLQHGGDPAYEARWAELTTRLAGEGRGVVSRQTGVASVRLDCLHCRASMTSAAESQLPPDHYIESLFVQPYKQMQRERRRASDE